MTSESCEDANVLLNYWDISLKYQGVLQVNILSQKGLESLHYLISNKFAELTPSALQVSDATWQNKDISILDSPGINIHLECIKSAQCCSKNILEL